MTAKEYLSQAYKIDNDINSKLEQVASPIFHFSFCDCTRKTHPPFYRRWICRDLNRPYPYTHQWLCQRSPLFA